MKRSFWARIVDWFRVADARFQPGEAATQTANWHAQGRSAEPAPPPSSRAGTPPVEEKGNHRSSSNQDDSVLPAALVKLAKRDQAVEKLQEGYSRVVALVDSIHTHLEEQKDRTDDMRQSLQTLARYMAEQPAQGRAQIAALERIERQMESQSQRSRKLDENLSELPRLADAQRETLATVGRHLDRSGDQFDRITGALGEFKDTVKGVGEAASAASSREERLAQLVEEQTKRFTWFAVIAVVVAMISAGVALAAIFR